MSQNDFNLANQPGASYRADANDAFQALASTNSGNTAPSTLYAQQMWVDTNTPSSTVWTLYMYDGAQHIEIGLIDSTNNIFTPSTNGTSTWSGTSGGTANALTLMPTVPALALQIGQTFSFLAGNTNSGATTVAISAISAVAIKKQGTTALAAGDLTAGQIYTIQWDGTNFQLAAATLQTITLTGDVTGSGTGSFAVTIANGAVTNAKMADMVAKMVKARKTNSTGAPEDCTITELLDFITGTPAQGDIIYRNASTWVRLAAGTTGQFLKTQGGGANPIWASASGSGTIQLFTTSGTWTKPAGLGSNSLALIECIGGGGGAQDAHFSAGGAGGGGSANVPKWILVSDLGSTETVTIGAGGTSGANGGNSSFGTWAVGYGGCGGVSSASSFGGGAGGGYFAQATASSNDSPGGYEGRGGQTSVNNGLGGNGIYLGGGGGGDNATGLIGGPGGKSIFGGGGGGGYGDSSGGAGGTSSFGGAGGNGASVSGAGTSGSIPGGGGGRGYTGGGNGARGQVKITILNLA